MSKIIKFINEVRAEFKNITWPKKETLIQLSIVVISISIIVSIILGGFDYLFTKSFALLTQSLEKNQTQNTLPIDPKQSESTDSAQTTESATSEIENFNLENINN
ncbi:preprotein translocase subunit SecE [Patescibacteria group bacterium]|nr:preprotein translocase subunit SecE [Patescibacteria group bacterium]MCG2701979.1 preprotein translocase subunit SecE [Candidatus Parcubacteria bacterium]MBU4265019.1 preprotein translocase subunit SecE [Patescibacteria group bacterium]MBU4390172.1 preprotein translocase subunit SecE [Patescibacteria group bacterium]MBU4397105.1 preprotein translocase subunit SecE [Patescibacteria group bacterium]